MTDLGIAVLDWEVRAVHAALLEDDNLEIIANIAEHTQLSTWTVAAALRQLYTRGLVTWQSYEGVSHWWACR